MKILNVRIHLTDAQHFTSFTSFSVYKILYLDANMYLSFSCVFSVLLLFSLYLVLLHTCPPDISPSNLSHCVLKLTENDIWSQMGVKNVDPWDCRQT